MIKCVAAESIIKWSKSFNKWTHKGTLWSMEMCSASHGILQAHIPRGPAYTTLKLKVEHACMRKCDLSMHDLWGTWELLVSGLALLEITQTEACITDGVGKTRWPTSSAHAWNCRELSTTATVCVCRFHSLGPKMLQARGTALFLQTRDHRMPLIYHVLSYLT